MCPLNVLLHAIVLAFHRMMSSIISITRSRHRATGTPTQNTLLLSVQPGNLVLRGL